MLVFFKEKLVVLAVPKTGTTAYETALKDRADIVISDPPLLKHAPVYRYNRFLRPMFKQVCGVEPELMAVMREPISWLGSWYRYRRRAFLDGQPNSTANVSFDDFLNAYAKGQKPDFANVGSQAKFLETQPNGCGVTHLFRYEDQTSITAFLEDRLNLELRLERKNESPDMDLEWREATEQKLRRKCAGEFERYAAIP